MDRDPHAAAIVGVYQRHGLAWAADRGSGLQEQAWLDRFAALLPPSGAVLDLGCGAGRPIAEYLTGRGHPVTGVDTAPALLGLCRQMAPSGTWLEADMRTLALGRTFNGILAWDSFFHLDHDDQRRMFPVFARHAAPGAALMFTSGPSHGVAMGTLHGEPLFHASLDPAEYRALLAAAGFAVVAHVAEDPTCGGHTIWLAQASADP